MGRERGGKKQGGDSFATGIGRGSTGAESFVERFDLSRSGSGSGGVGSKLDLPGVRGEINRYREQVHAVQVRKAELEVLLAGVSYNEEEHVALCQRVEARWYRNGRCWQNREL